MHKQKITQKRDVIAIVPAAGKATRLAPLPCSKELFPIGFRHDPVNQTTTAKPVCLYLLEKFRNANIKKCFIVLRKGKWDIPDYLGPGDIVDMDLGYLLMGLPYGTAYTIDQAYHFVKNSNVAIGFPDILFSPDDAYTRILKILDAQNADVALGLFPADRPEKVDMVDSGSDLVVKNIEIKPSQTKLVSTWGIAVWTPSFTQFLHGYLQTLNHDKSDSELFIGHVIQAAIEQGLKVIADTVSQTPYIDIGTSDDLLKAVIQFSTDNDSINLPKE